MLSTEDGEQDGGDVEAGLQRVDEAGVGDWAARAVPRPSVQVLTLILHTVSVLPLSIQFLKYFDLAGELQQLILLIFHNPQYCVVPADMQRPLYVLMGHCLTIPFLIISKPSDKSIKDNYHQTEACILNHLVSLFVCVSLY